MCIRDRSNALIIIIHVTFINCELNKNIFKMGVYSFHVSSFAAEMRDYIMYLQKVGIGHCQ